MGGTAIASYVAPASVTAKRVGLILLMFFVSADDRRVFGPVTMVGTSRRYMMFGTTTQVSSGHSRLGSDVDRLVFIASNLNLKSVAPESDPEERREI